MDRRAESDNANGQSAFSMAGGILQSSEFADPYVTITQVINVKDQKEMENEAFVTHLKRSINELQAVKTKIRDELNVLKAENQVLENEVGAYTSIERKSLEEKSNILMTLKWQVENREAKLEEQMNIYKRTHNRFYEKYKEIRGVYEDYHPMYKEYKQTKIDKLRLEVELKMLQAKIVGQKKRNKLHRDILQKLFYDNCVKIAKFVLEYREMQKTNALLKEETEHQAMLLQKLREVELLAAKKEAELQRGSSYQTALQISDSSNVNFMAHQLTALHDADNANSITHAIQPYSSFMLQNNIFTLDSMSKSGEILQQIRSRCGQRQQQWLQRHIISPTSAISTKNTSSGLKRPMICENSNLSPDTSKIFKTTPKTTATQSTTASTQIVNKNSKANIISIYNINNDTTTTANKKSLASLESSVKKIAHDVKPAQDVIMQKLDQQSSQPHVNENYADCRSLQVTTREAPPKMPIPDSHHSLHRLSQTSGSQLLSDSPASAAIDSSRYLLSSQEKVSQPQQLSAQKHFFTKTQFHNPGEGCLTENDNRIAQNQVNKNNEPFKPLMSAATPVKFGGGMTRVASISHYFNAPDMDNATTDVGIAKNETNAILGVTSQPNTTENLMGSFFASREHNTEDNFEIGSNISYSADYPSPLQYDESGCQAGELQVQSPSCNFNFGDKPQACNFFGFNLGNNEGPKIFNMF